MKWHFSGLYWKPNYVTPSSTAASRSVVLILWSRARWSRLGTGRFTSTSNCGLWNSRSVSTRYRIWQTNSYWEVSSIPCLNLFLCHPRIKTALFMNKQNPVMKTASDLLSNDHRAGGTKSTRLIVLKLFTRKCYCSGLIDWILSHNLGALYLFVINLPHTDKLLSVLYMISTTMLTGGNSL